MHLLTLSLPGTGFIMCQCSVKPATIFKNLSLVCNSLAFCLLVVEWVGATIAVRHIWEVFSSELSKDTDYDYRVYVCGFPQALQANARVVSWFGPQPLPSKSFSLHLSLYCSMLWSLTADIVRTFHKER
jgi:hypothetical protein